MLLTLTKITEDDPGGERLVPGGVFPAAVEVILDYCEWVEYENGLVWDRVLFEHLGVDLNCINLGLFQ
jgi:hypothetical protein